MTESDWEAIWVQLPIANKLNAFRLVLDEVEEPLANSFLCFRDLVHRTELMTAEELDTFSQLGDRLAKLIDPRTRL